MGRKTVKFNKSGIVNLTNDKPVVYRIMSKRGKTVYAGVASRGRMRDRLEDHLRRGRNRIPGITVEIEQLDNIAQARKRELDIIAKTNPKYNKQRIVVPFFEPVSFSKEKARNAVKKRAAKK